MAKRGRKKRDRKHTKANHGKRPQLRFEGSYLTTDDGGAADLHSQPRAK